MTERRPSTGRAEGPVQGRKRTHAVLVYALVIVSLQIFLLIVAAEGLLGEEHDLAWSAAVLSTVLFLMALGFGRLLSDS